MKNIQSLAALATCAALAVSAGSAHADPLAVTSYDMPNGNGIAVGGSFNYWDGNYDGAGHPHVDGSFLSGGTGALTDGVIASAPWNEVSNKWGTGEYVGWFQTSPTIDFHFGSVVSIAEIRLNVDNTHIGGVTAPSAIIVNGTTFANPAWETAGAAEMIDLTGLNVVGESVSVQLVNPASWVFLSEAWFATPVPEPASGVLLLAGLGALGLAARRSRR